MSFWFPADYPRPVPPLSSGSRDAGPAELLLPPGRESVPLFSRDGAGAGPAPLPTLLLPRSLAVGGPADLPGGTPPASSDRSHGRAAEPALATGTERSPHAHPANDDGVA